MQRTQTYLKQSVEDSQESQGPLNISTRGRNLLYRVMQFNISVFKDINIYFIWFRGTQREMQKVLIQKKRNIFRSADVVHILQG